MAKTVRYKPLVKKVVHPKKYTDPLEDEDFEGYIDEELSPEEHLLGGYLDDEVLF